MARRTQAARRFLSPVHVATIAVAVAAADAQVAGQDAIPRHAFFPDGYQFEYFLDLEALRENEFWDGIERDMFVRSMLRMLEREGHLYVDDVDRVWGARVETAEREVDVLFLEGTDGLALPDPIDGFEQVTIADKPALRTTGGAPQLWLVPSPGTRVVGPEDHLRAAADEPSPTGTADPDLRALVADYPALAYLVTIRGDRTREDWESGVVPAEAWNDEDPLDALMLRLAVDDAGEIFVAATLRFARGTAGQKAARAEIEGFLAELEQREDFAAHAALLEGVELTEAGRELHITLQLGPPQQAGQKIVSSLFVYTTVAPDFIPTETGKD